MTVSYPSPGTAALVDFEKTLRWARQRAVDGLVRTLPVDDQCVISEELALYFGLITKPTPPTLEECCRAFAHLRLSRTKLSKPPLLHQALNPS